MHHLTSAQRVLLLQGPMGSFFFRFGRFLEAQGVHVLKITLNGGGWLFSRGLNTLNYRGSMQDWPQFLVNVLQERQIDRIYLFGDCRAYHRDAMVLARTLGIRVFVFEEGYIRPDYVTLEEGGTNGFSSLPQDPEFYRQYHARQAAQVAALPPVQPALTSFRRMALSAMGYYLAGAWLRPFFPHYKHHKSFSILQKSATWCRSGVRKTLYQMRDTRLTGRLEKEWSQRYFLVVLQVHNDFQLRFHSRFGDVRDFITETITSFAQHAPADTLLVLKHHPMDRGARHYGQLIDALAAQFAIAHRVIYCHQIHLPTALSNARGVVLVNSTVGLSALSHRAPVKVLGRAVYDMEGLTCQQPLEQFWNEPGGIDLPLLSAFRHYLVTHTQLNGSFFGRDPFSDIVCPASTPLGSSLPLPAHRADTGSGAWEANVAMVANTATTVFVDYDELETSRTTTSADAAQSMPAPLERIITIPEAEALPSLPLSSLVNKAEMGLPQAARS